MSVQLARIPGPVQFDGWEACAGSGFFVGNHASGTCSSMITALEAVRWTIS